MRHGRRFIPYLILSFQFALGHAVEADEGLINAEGRSELPSVEQSKTEGNFSHSVLPGAYPGTPGSIIFASSENRPAQVRALLTLDDSLLVIPLYPNEEGAFVGTFPTPERKITYQFQFQGHDEKARLSKRFVVLTECAEGARKSGSEPKEMFPEQLRLIEEALSLEREIELESVVTKILVTYLREKAE